MLGMLREGGGEALITAICGAPRALVFISVPWSGPEQQGRYVFRSAVATLDEKYSDLSIDTFRLGVDEDETSQRLLASLGYPQFAEMGSGSLIWLRSGEVVDTEPTAIFLGAAGIVARSISAW